MFQLQAVLDGVKTLKNNTLKITLETQDISSFSSEELAELFKLNDKLIWAVFKETPVKAEDIKIEEVKEFKTDKSPSQRLRASLYVLWEQSGKPGDFQTEYYPKQMNKLIDFIKEKLN